MAASCTVAAAIDARPPAPRFNARTLDGERFTNDTVKGKGCFNPVLEDAPLYILIDRDGKLVGKQEGSGGEEALRALRARTGIGLEVQPYARQWNQVVPARRPAQPAAAHHVPHFHSHAEPLG